MKNQQLIILISVIIVVMPWFSFASEWQEDESRLRELEKVKVGILPDEDLDLLHSLCFFNQRVKESNLPSNCRLFLHSDPEPFINKIGMLTITNTMLYEAKDFKQFGIESYETIPEAIAQLNLREFLWLIYTKYVLEVYYEPLYIKIGYGWGGPCILTPGKRFRIVEKYPFKELNIEWQSMNEVEKELLRKRAQTNSEAAFQLYLYHESDLNEPWPAGMSDKWLKRAAELGNTNAIAILKRYSP